MPGRTDYAALLAQLDSSAFPTLREAQAAALALYAAEHAETADLAIELPTGAGKSLIALLICEAWRREGLSAAMLTGNKTLARQMEVEAQLLGIPVVRFEGAGHTIPLGKRRLYHRAHAVAVMNYWVLFNQNPVLDAADLLVIDDAHLAEGPLDSLYSVTIDRYAHPTLFASLVRELADRFPDYATFQDAIAMTSRHTAGPSCCLSSIRPPWPTACAKWSTPAPTCRRTPIYAFAGSVRASG